MNVIKDILGYAQAPYMRMWWVLLVVYVLCYALAWILAHIGGPGRIIVRCRQAWAWAFLVHLITVLGVLIYWYQTYSSSQKLWLHFPPYLVLVVVDAVFSIKLFVGVKRYRF